jgi:hypothetical protein
MFATKNKSSQGNKSRLSMKFVKLLKEKVSWELSKALLVELSSLSMNAAAS